MSSPKREQGWRRLWRDPSLVACALCGVLLLEAPIAGHAAVEARLDRSTAGEGGAVTLDIESEGAPSGAQPDLSPLQKDFVVLGSATQSETSFVNGRRADRQRWSVRLQPRHAGALVVPPIALGNERTAALQVDVTGPSPQEAAEVARHVFVEVEAADAGRSVYVQQQVPYTVRLYFDDTIQKGEFSTPNPADAVVEQLGEEKHGTAVRAGRPYNVIERNYAISPEKSGTLRIPPVTFSGSQVVPRSGPEPGQGDAEPTDDLFARLLRGAPLAMAPGMPFAEPSQPVSAESRDLVVSVKPRPAAAHGDWLPAEALVLHDSWQDQPPSLTAGEPATRIITIEAKGLSASQIPPLSLAQADARLYPEAAENHSRTDGRTIFGISTQKVTYIPNAQGVLDVPPVELAWWNTTADEPRKAVLQALRLRVAPGVTGPSAGTATTSSAARMTGPADHEIRNVARSIWNRRLLGHRVGPAGALLLAALFAIGFTAWGLQRRRLAGGTVLARPPRARAPTTAGLQTLRNACLSDDRQAAADALLALAHARWPNDPPRSLGALALRLDEGAAEVHALDRVLYGPQDRPWQGAALWQGLAAWTAGARP